MEIIEANFRRRGNPLPWIGLVLLAMLVGGLVLGGALVNNRVDIAVFSALAALAVSTIGITRLQGQVINVRLIPDQQLDVYGVGYDISLPLPLDYCLGIERLPREGDRPVQHAVRLVIRTPERGNLILQEKIPPGQDLPDLAHLSASDVSRVGVLTSLTDHPGELWNLIQALRR